MKHKFFAAALFCALVPAAFAQGVILRGGMNFAKAVTDPKPTSPSNREYRQGLNGALLGEFGDGPMRLQLGAGYENKRMHLTGAGGGDIRLDYMTIPLMVSLGTNMPEGLNGPRLFVNLGIEPAFLLNSDYAGNSFTFTFNNAEQFDFNLRAETGIELPFSYSGPAGILGLGYTYGLTDANSDCDTWHNDAFHLFLGIKIGTL